MTHYLLMYHYVSDIAQRRGPYRDEHLRRLWDEHDHGRVLIAGAAGEPALDGVILFVVDEAAQIEAFVARDPYVLAGLVESYEVVPYNSVVGDIAANPIRPA